MQGRNKRRVGARKGMRVAKRPPSKAHSRTHKHTPLEKKAPVRSIPLFEVEVLDGLAHTCREEIKRLIGTNGRLLPSREPDRIAFEYAGQRSKLLTLRTAVAVFELLYYKVPHPKTVVQGPHLVRLLSTIASTRARSTFRSFRVGAAGSNSVVFKDIKQIIATESGLALDEDTGEMSIRFRRSRVKHFGWDVLVRLTPMPLSARPWRVENMPGALNATIAAALIFQMEPRPEDRFLNLMCGSGTLIAERASICPAKALIGIDSSEQALAKATRNLAHVNSLTLLKEDAGRLSLKNGSVNAICSDLPWGRLIGKRDELEVCYREALREITRVCSPGGRLAIITQEIAPFEKALQVYKKHWRVISSSRIKQSDYRPKVYLLGRTSHPYHNVNDHHEVLSTAVNSSV